MGDVASVIKAFSCDSCAKYVCNALDIRSQCCDEYCEFEVSTERVDLSRDDSDYEIEVDGCCMARKTENRKCQQ